MVSGDRVRYTPSAPFTGVRPFTYTFCDIVDANGKKECDSATVTVIVGKPPEDPRIDSVQPDPSPPNRTVVVKGTTGTCDTAAKLTLNSAPTAATPVPMTGGQDGDFEAKLEIPVGAFVGPYVLKAPRCLLRNGEGGRARADSAEQATGRGRRPIRHRRHRRPADQPSGARQRPRPRRPRRLRHPGDSGARPCPTARPWRGTMAPSTTSPARSSWMWVRIGSPTRYCDVVGADDRTDNDTATVTVTEAPEAVDDPGIVTVQGEPIAIKVMANDRNAGELDIPKLQVRTDPAPQGEARPQSDGTIEYRPGPAFTGVDSFQYDCGGPS